MKVQSYHLAKYFYLWKFAIHALHILVKDRGLLIAAFLPGIVTLASTALSILFIWHAWLTNWNVWLAVLMVMVGFPLLWIIYGNFALLFVEDWIIDRVQISEWREIRWPAPPLSVKNVYSDIVSALLLSLLLFILFIISFFPGTVAATFIAAAYTTAWTFLNSIYKRRRLNFRDKLYSFFSHPLKNLSLGILLNFLLFVPILNVWMVGYAVVVSSLIEMHRSGSKDDPGDSSIRK